MGKRKKEKKSKKKSQLFDLEKLSFQQQEQLVRVKFQKLAFLSIQTAGFTNYFKDETEFQEKYSNIFGKIIPEITTKTLTELSTNSKYRFHKITESDHLQLYSKIIKELFKKENNISTLSSKHQEYIKQKFLDAEIYQIGINEIDNLRLICILNQDTLEILFFDIHHLIYESIKYNEKDYLKYKFTPILEMVVK